MPILLYIPNLHNGVLQFLQKYSVENGTLWIIGSDVAQEFSTLHVEIRAIDPNKIGLMINALGIFNNVQVLDQKNVKTFSAKKIITA